ncbi:hypothetical protein L1887_45911 [Cichorium endivia]|nr:hypothetical protein L1887_45911 [Cichorium endivia]
MSSCIGSKFSSRSSKPPTNFQSELLSITFKQTFRKHIKSIYVGDIGTTITKYEIFQILVVDPMMGAIDVDWRDFFPYLKWIPKTRFEKKLPPPYGDCKTGNHHHR